MGYGFARTEASAGQLSDVDFFEVVLVHRRPAVVGNARNLGFCYMGSGLAGDFRRPGHRELLSLARIQPPLPSRYFKPPHTVLDICLGSSTR